MLPEIGTCITTRQAKDYYSHTILRKTTPFYSSESSSSPSIPHSHLQNEESNSSVEIGTREPFLKRILVVDDDPDITLTFKVGLEDDKSFEVYIHILIH